MIAKLTVALLLVGCSASPRQVTMGELEKATNVVWRQAYGEFTPTPQVHWLPESVLDCDGGWGFTEIGKCFAGMAYNTSYKGEEGWTWDVKVALHDSSIMPSGSLLAHELLHEHLFAQTGNADAGHTWQEWQPNGLLDQANAILLKEDL